MICPKTQLGSVLETIKQLLIDNEYPDVLFSCIKEKLASLSSEKQLGPESSWFT